MKRWGLLCKEASRTASYDERTSKGTGDGESGGMSRARMEARGDMQRVCGGVGVSGEYEPGYIPSAYWRVCENCIRFEEPAGVIGSNLGRSAPSARALTVAIGRAHV